MKSETCRKFYPLRSIFTFGLAVFSLSPIHQIFADESKEEPFEVHLKDPFYTSGILSTDEGGVITGPGLRIQARHLIYTNRLQKGKWIQTVEAWGDLMADFNGRVYIGDHLSYDFVSKSGIIIGGRTAITPWYISGQQITLQPKGCYIISDASVTTSETADRLWDIKAKQLEICDKYYASAKVIQARVGGFPVFAIPYYRANLKQFWNDSPASYKVVWDKGQGPRFTMRYRTYATEDFDLYLRFDYRLKRGVGGALETNYYAPSGRGLFLTKNYLAYDTFFNDNNPNKFGTRYRLQGQLQYHSEGEKTEIYGSWDKISDQELPGDFHMEDFELNIQKLTRFYIRQQEKAALLDFHFKPRINYFDSLKQELPQMNLSMHPWAFSKLGIISENRVKAGYLDYVYAEEIDNFVFDFNAWRMQAKHNIYRPFHTKAVSFTPSIGIDGIFYSNSPEHDAAGQFVLQYSLDAKSYLSKGYRGFVHTLRPYMQYLGLTSPTIRPDNVYIFSIQDGLHQLNQLRIGLQNDIFSSGQPILPRFAVDIYALGFFWDTSFQKKFPKLFTDIQWNFPKIRTSAKLGWNLEENVLDVGNVRIAWTWNEYFAIAGEFRHRSRFYWKKADLDNYILDVARPISELLDSPLSDQRNAALLTFQMQIAPEWIVRLQSHYGWGRKNEPGYAEAKIDLLGLISSSWRARLSYMHTVRDDRVTFGLSLVRK
ncbi:MAG: hypothetical protein Tsb0015_13900 [Simkaniaceae bacterium]